MAPKFGTSGLRGLVTELTDPLCAGYTRAFLAAADTNGTVLIGRDLRASSSDISHAVAGAIASQGLRPLDCGVLPTPALALAAASHKTAAVMVTGSHIPDDRNGLKFYTAAGEITKADETSITAGYAPFDCPRVAPAPKDDALPAYRARYRDFFGPDALKGLKLGLYEHSSAARDVLGHILSDLGAEVVRLGRSDHFIPVDTEAVDPEMREQLTGWAATFGLDAIVSTDGDGDRPMVTDGAGRIVPGDRLGPLTALSLGADTVVTPVSANSCVDLMGEFRVIRTEIGSPFVIAGLERAFPAKAIGYEPNGGFLTAFDVTRASATLPALMTRDSTLPIVAPLALARTKGISVAELVADLPPRYTAADRLQGIESEVSGPYVKTLDPSDGGPFTGLGDVTDVDRTDGLRVTFSSGRIAHLRPSGNAPEFRVYAEAESQKAAEDVMRSVMSRVSEALG